MLVLISRHWCERVVMPIFNSLFFPSNFNLPILFYDYNSSFQEFVLESLYILNNEMLSLNKEL